MNEEIKIEPIEMDNEIVFRGSVSLSKEEIEKRVDFLEEHSKEFNKLVIKAENELYIKELLKRNNQLQSNWNSLRECIISVIEGAREELNTIIHTTDISTEAGLEYVNQCSREFDVIRKNLEIVLDKMNELEGKDKDGK